MVVLSFEGGVAPTCVLFTEEEGMAKASAMLLEPGQTLSFLIGCTSLSWVADPHVMQR